MISSFSSRPLAALFATLALCATTPAMAQTPEAPPSTIPIEIQFSSERAPLPYTLDNGLLFFEAMIGDTPVHVLLDNGADTSIIDEALARRLGFQITALNQSMTAVDGQQRPQFLAQQIPFSIPGQFDTTTAMMATDLTPISALFSRPVDVILGSEFFTLAIGIDRLAGTIDFTPSGVMSFKDATTIPLSADDVVDVEVAGQPVRLELDLGDNSGASLYPDVFARVLPDIETTEGRFMGVFGGSYTMRQAQDIPTTLGEMKITGAVSEAVRLPKEEVADGRLGSATFLLFSVIIDRGAGKIQIRPPFTSLPTASAEPAGPMSAAEIRRRWTELMARPTPEIMASSETPMLLGVMFEAATAYRVLVRESAAAGAPRACPPEQADLSPDEIVARIGEMPEGEQAEDFGVVLGRIFDARYPCPAAS